MHKTVLLEFLSEIILIPMDVYCYSNADEINIIGNWPLILLCITIYQRRLISLILLLISDFISQIIRTLSDDDDFDDALTEVFEIISSIDNFVAFSFHCNAIMFIKNAYTIFAVLIKVLLKGAHILDDPNNIGNLLWTSCFLPTEIVRLWAMIQGFDRVKRMVGKKINSLFMY